MTTKAVKVRVRAGHLEPLEKLELPEGAELTVTVEVPEESRVGARRPAALRTWDLGIKGPLTREEIYEDVG